MPLTFAAMQPAHLPGALRLSADAGWPHREKDWRLILDISRGFAALQEGEVLATALATPFGDAAMVNMVIVDALLRRMGIARAMMERHMAATDPASWHLVAQPMPAGRSMRRSAFAGPARLHSIRELSRLYFHPARHAGAPWQNSRRSSDWIG